MIFTVIPLVIFCKNNFGITGRVKKLRSGQVEEAGKQQQTLCSSARTPKKHAVGTSLLSMDTARYQLPQLLLLLLLLPLLLQTTTAWEYSQTIDQPLTSTARLQGTVQLSSSRTSFTQVTGKLFLAFKNWNAKENLPACGPTGVNEIGTCSKAPNSNINWNEQASFLIDFTLETPTTTDCTLSTVTATTTVRITNQKCVENFPTLQECAVETQQPLKFVNGKVVREVLTSLTDWDVAKLENMLTASDALSADTTSSSGAKFQLDLETMLATSVGRYTQTPPDDPAVIAAQSLLSQLGISAKLTIVLDHLWSAGISSLGASLSMNFEWGWLEPAAFSSSATPPGATYLYSARGDVGLMSLLSIQHSVAGAVPCFGYHEQDGNLCIVTSSVPFGSAWEKASKCTTSVDKGLDQDRDGGEIDHKSKLNDGCGSGGGGGSSGSGGGGGSTKKSVRRRRASAADDINAKDHLCHDNGEQYYNVHDGGCTTKGQDPYTNQNSKRLACCSGLKLCWEPRSDRGKAAFEQKHAGKLDVPDTAEVCREVCCEGTQGVGKCGGSSRVGGQHVEKSAVIMLMWSVTIILMHIIY